MRVLLLLLVLVGSVARAQTVKNLFAGEWVEKKTGRHLRIEIIAKWNLAEISDWRGDYYAKGAMVDVYKAAVKGNKLVMAEDRVEHRATYAELVLRGPLLVYRWKGLEQTNRGFVDSAVFVRRKQ